MSFLDVVWYKPSTWLNGATDGVMGAILNGIRTMCFWLVSVFYELIGTVYNLFDKLCNARLLSDGVLAEMSKRIGYILGIVMLFYIIFSFIQMLIDPEKISNKESGAASIIKKSIFVIVMLGLSNFIFNGLYSLQSTVIEANVISKLILPFSLAEEDEENFGNLLSENLLEAFYYIDDSIINDDSKLSDADLEKKDGCKIIVDSFYTQIIKKNRYDTGYTCLNEAVTISGAIDVEGVSSIEDQYYLVSFNGLLAVAAGIYTVYILLMYCFKVGVRMIQLAFLEIISPMAIISYLSPKKDNMFGKWIKTYFATYIDVFIRIAIIDFVIFLICTIFSASNENFVFWKTVGAEGTKEEMFFMVIIVLALLTFAKKAPDLLKKLLPGGDSNLGFGTSMKDIIGLEKTLGVVAGAGTSAAVGLIGGIAGGKGVVSRVTGAFSGLAGGVFRGGSAGFKSKGLGNAISTARSNQAKVNLARAQRIASGSKLSERIGDSARDMFGIQSGYETFNQELSMSNMIKETFGGEDIIKHIREVRQSYIQSCAASGMTADVNKLAAYDDAEKEAMRQMYAFAHNNDIGSTWVHIEDKSIGLDFTEEYKTNRGIYKQIQNNEKRAGKKFETFDQYDTKIYNRSGHVISTIKANPDQNWKADNISLKTKIANKTKSGK